MASLRNVEDVVPAQLSFLTIYNPSFSTNDEDVKDQILFYYSARPRDNPKKSSSGSKEGEVDNDALNERLRQVGLAQGMVNFASAFSEGETLDAIESEKSRILLHELEPGWWILASIDLTRLKSQPERSITSAAKSDSKPSYEYSSREVCPQALLIEQLKRAHRVFLLHHGSSLEELHARLTKAKFSAILERFWNRFILRWDVLLRGNPAVDVFNGIKLAAGGELGIGVGEEEWGSGEREVLEGFVGRTEGLVDLVVSRFGDAPRDAETASVSTRRSTAKSISEPPGPWLGAGKNPGCSDGLIFSGVGAMDRPSLRSLSAWIEWLYRDGSNAYGVQDHPKSSRRRRRKQESKDIRPKRLAQRTSSSATIVPQRKHDDTETTRDQSPDTIRQAQAVVTSPGDTTEQKTEAASNAPESSDAESSYNTDTLVKYLTLGVYGSSWGIPIRKAEPASQDTLPATKGSKETKAVPHSTDSKKSQFQTDTSSTTKGRAQEPDGGYFLIGLHGNLDLDDLVDEEASVSRIDTEQEDGGSDVEGSNRRIMMRALYLHRIDKKNQESSSTSGDVRVTTTTSTRLRVVVYIHRPFIYAFLFETSTDSLTLTALYKSLHHQLGPLRQALLSSTSPANVFRRLADASSLPDVTPSNYNQQQPIYDFVYDPYNLTVHTTIPNIPEPGTAAAEGLSLIPSDNMAWTRIAALNVHSHILATHIMTRRHLSEAERTSKTSRGWWVVWMRLPIPNHTPTIDGEGPQANQASLSAASFREAYLVRKAREEKTSSSSGLRKASASWMGRGESANSATGAEAGQGGWSAGRITEGIGVDTRKYIEGLLSLNR
ncbi:hypothetical protein MMC25_007014 [Agyrium rufum]|nr:hypothetical protein [Agyrium rufum]